MQFLADLTHVDILLSPFEHDWDFLSFVRKNINKPIKIMSKETLISRFYHGNESTAIRYLIEQKAYRFDQAEATVHECFHPLLMDIKQAKVNTLIEVKNELMHQGIYRQNPYIVNEFSGKSIGLFGYDDLDQELQQILQLLNVCSITYIQDEIREVKLPCASFSSLDDEVYFVFQKVINLLQNGQSPQSIHLVVRSREYDFALRYFAYHFSLPINMPSNVSLYALPFTKTFLNSPNQNTLALIKDDTNEVASQLYVALGRLLNQYPQGNLSLADYQALMTALTKKTMLPSPRYQNGIQVVRTLPFDEHKPVFILGFNEKTYPRLSKDDDFLSNSTKISLHRNTSIIENAIEKAATARLLSRYHIGYITFKYASNEGEFYPSPLIEELALSVEHAPWIRTQYSRRLAEMDYAIRLDSIRKYRMSDPISSLYQKQLTIPYLQYSSAFSGVEAITKHTFLNLSYSKIADFYKCPFLYYIKHVLKLNVFEDTFKAKFGSLAHDVLMHRYQEGYHFDDQFAYQKAMREFSSKEEVLLLRLKEELRQVDDWLNNHERLMKKVAVFCEKDIEVEIDDFTRLSGRIDKMYVTTDGYKEYLFVIDYKTSQEVFKEQHIAYGFSLQLPIYAFLIAHEPTLSPYELSGLYIQPIFLNVATAQEESFAVTNYQKAFRYTGITTDVLPVIATFDNTYMDNSIIAGTIMNKDGSTRKNAAIRNREFFATLDKQAETKICEALASIRSNNFQITPRTVTGVSPCQYCEFRHMCFRKDSDVTFIKTSVKEENSDE